jgi:hypothetical protein
MLGGNMTDAKGAFSFPNFRLLTQARFLFGFAVQLQAVVMGWQVYRILGDPLYLELDGEAEEKSGLRQQSEVGEGESAFGVCHVPSKHNAGERKERDLFPS